MFVQVNQMIMKQRGYRLSYNNMRKYRRKNTRAKRVIFALVAILCILIIIAVAFYVFSWKKQSDTDKQVNMDAAEFIIPDMADQSNDEKTEETVTQTGTEDTVNVKSTKKQTDSKNSSTNQSKKKNTTEQSETGTSVTPEKNGSNNESNNTGNNTSGDDNQGNNHSSGREKNELEIIPSE